jgi:hypothetical protein
VTATAAVARVLNLARSNRAGSVLCTVKSSGVMCSMPSWMATIAALLSACMMLWVVPPVSASNAATRGGVESRRSPQWAGALVR